jgi:hypothetical protein
MTTPDTPTKPPPLSRRAKIGAVVVLLAVGGGCGVWSALTGGNGNPTAEDAAAACRDYVSARLRAPATADFSEERYTDRGSGYFLVTGAVDSDNAFGVPIRNTYRCEVRQSGETWQLVSLTGLTN